MVQVDSARPTIVEVEVKRPRLTAVVLRRPAFDYSSTAKPVVVTSQGIPLMVICQSGAPIGAGQSTFLGRFDSQTEKFVALPVGASDVIELFIFADAPPGAGESYTYTLRKIAAGAVVGSDQAITGAINGDSQQELRLTGSVAYADLSKIDIKLVTSGGAAEVNHVVVPKFSF